MENTLVVIDPKEFGLEEIQANEITKGLSQIIAEREVLSSQYAEAIKLEITKENIQVFKKIRLLIRDNRTKGFENWHKVNKAFFWNGGKFVDAIKNKEVAENERMEANLLANEQFFENIEKQRIADSQTSRAAEIASYQELGSFVPGNLGELTDEVYANYLLGVKTAFETKKAAEKAAKEAEEKRLADEKAEQERIRIENEQLKKASEKREAEIAKERAKAEQERKDREANEKAEREAHEKALAAEREKAAEAQRQLEAKAEQERKAAQEAVEKAEAELAKGDTDKLNDLIADLKALKSKYQFKAKKNQQLYTGVGGYLDKLVGYIKEGGAK